MNTESTYVCHGHSSDEGLGRMALPASPLNRAVPEVASPLRNLERPRPFQPADPPPRRAKPTPALKPVPIIDHNPARGPRIPLPANPKTAPKNLSPANKKPATPSSKNRTSAVPTKHPKLASSQNGQRAGLLEGTISMGGYSVKKNHLAMAGGAVAGSLLLVKLLR